MPNSITFAGKLSTFQKFKYKSEKCSSTLGQTRSQTLWMCDVDIIGTAQLLLESNWVEGEGCKDWVKGRAKVLPELLRKGVQGRSSIRWESKDFK